MFTQIDRRTDRKQNVPDHLILKKQKVEVSFLLFIIKLFLKGYRKNGPKPKVAIICFSIHAIQNKAPETTMTQVLCDYFNRMK